MQHPHNAALDTQHHSAGGGTGAERKPAPLPGPAPFSHTFPFTSLLGIADLLDVLKFKSAPSCTHAAK